MSAVACSNGEAGGKSFRNNCKGKVPDVLEMDGRITGEWYKINHLETNLSKYQVMMMTKGNGNITDVDIDNNTIRQTEQMKLLGVTLDKDLNFSEHVSSICKTTSKKIGVLKRLRSIDEAAIMPYFNYCSLVWHFCKGSDKNKLKQTNERELRAVFLRLGFLLHKAINEG